LITAGPTVEDIDPVRFISNRSSGKMGYAIAQAAQQRGAEVVLISGPSDLPVPRAIRCVQVRSALQMRDAVMQEIKTSDALIMAAAVADYHVQTIAAHKLKKTDELELKLIKNPDILAELGGNRKGNKRPLLIGFALETENLLAQVQDKLRSKNVDMIVGNLASESIGHDQNTAVIATQRGHVELARMPKDQLAH